MTQDYVDGDGYPRRVELPEGARDPSLGVPVSADWEALGLPDGIGARLARELFDRGLVTPRDFHKPNALRLIQGALQAVLKIDANTIHAVLSGRANGNRRIEL